RPVRGARLGSVLRDGPGGRQRCASLPQTGRPAPSAGRASAAGTFANQRRMARMNVQRIAGALGAEITGIDLRRLDDTEVAEIRRGWLGHLVVFFRQQALSPGGFRAFARRIGRPKAEE